MDKIEFTITPTCKENALYIYSIHITANNVEIKQFNNKLNLKP